MPDKCTSWTKEQQANVDTLVMRIADIACTSINVTTPALTAMDKRPKKVWTEAHPDVFFPYVSQALLEDLIYELQSRV